MAPEELEQRIDLASQALKAGSQPNGIIVGLLFTLIQHAADERRRTADSRVCPPGSMLLPASRQEAEAMNCVSEKFLKDGVFSSLGKEKS